MHKLKLDRACQLLPNNSKIIGNQLWFNGIFVEFDTELNEFLFYSFSNGDRNLEYVGGVELAPSEISEILQIINLLFINSTKP